MNQLALELRQAATTLVRQLSLPLLAVLVLGLGIGANTAIFSIVHAALVRPLPLPEPERVVILYEQRIATGEDTLSSPAVFTAWETGTRSFSALSPVGFEYYTVTGAGDPERLLGARVDADFFAVMGLRPAVGRPFVPADDRPGAPPVAVLRHSYWQSRFGADPGVLDRTVSLDGVDHRVVGVMPPGVLYPSKAQVWVPARFDEEERAVRWRYLFAAGRLAPGVDLEQARAESALVVERLAREHPESHAGWTANVVTLHEVLVGDARTSLFVLLVAVGLVLLVACANVAALLLVRSLARRREMALRAATGASPWRLFRLVLFESLLLAGGGAVAGIALASVGTALLVALLGTTLPAHADVVLDRAVLGGTALAALGSALLFGTAPALRAARLDLISALKGRQGGGLRVLRPLRALVVAEVALTMMVLVAAGLLARSFVNLRAIEPGFTADGVLAVPVSLPEGTARYPDETAERAALAETARRLAALPGVLALGAVDAPPLVWPAAVGTFTIAGRPVPAPDARPKADLRVVLGDYFDVLRIPVVAGRALSATDREGAPAVAVVDRELAARHWPAGGAVGETITIDEVDRVVVGVVGDVRQRDLSGDTTPTIYLPAGQEHRGGLTFVLRTAGDPGALAGAARRAVWEVDPELPLADLEPMADRLRAEAAGPRSVALLVGLFGALALVLAALGIYGVVSYSSLQRRGEIGVRLALGARRPQVLRQVSGEALALVGTGVLAGGVAAILANRWLGALLIGVGAGDPVVHLVTALLLALVGLAASYLPSRRAAGTELRTVLDAE